MYHLCARNFWSTTLNLHLFACANHERIIAHSPALPPPTHPQSPFQAAHAPAPHAPPGSDTVALSHRISASQAVEASSKRKSEGPHTKGPTRRAPHEGPHTKGPTRRAPHEGPHTKGPTRRAPHEGPHTKGPTRRAPHEGPHTKGPTRRAPHEGPHTKGPTRRAPHEGPHTKGPTRRAPHEGPHTKGPTRRAPHEGPHTKGPTAFVSAQEAHQHGLRIRSGGTSARSPGARVGTHEAVGITCVSVPLVAHRQMGDANNVRERRLNKALEIIMKLKNTMIIIMNITILIIIGGAITRGEQRPAECQCATCMRAYILCPKPKP
jgi:hypothetical protein